MKIRIQIEQSFNNQRQYHFDINSKRSISNSKKQNVFLFWNPIRIYHQISKILSGIWRTINIIWFDQNPSNLTEYWNQFCDSTHKSSRIGFMGTCRWWNKVLNSLPKSMKKKIVIMKCREFALIVCWTGNSTSRNKYILWIDADGISENFSESLAVIKWIWLVLWKIFEHWLELGEPKYRWRKNKRMLWWVSSLNNLQTNLLHESLCTSFDVAII